MATKQKETEKKETQTFTVRMPRGDYETLRTFAFVTDRSINDVVIKSIRDYLSTTGKSEEFRDLVSKARGQFRVALDKLKDL